MSRKSAVLLALWLLIGAGLCYDYAPASSVWDGDAEALRHVAPPLRTLLAASLLLWVGAGLAGRWLLAQPTGSLQALGWAALLVVWAVAGRGTDYCLAAERYALWKYQVTDEETRQLAFPAVTAQLLPLVLRDLHSPAESLGLRGALALALGESHTQASYAALQSVAEDPHQNPYLQFHCLKSLRLLQPQRFAARLSAVPDSARALYWQYEPEKL